MKELILCNKGSCYLSLGFGFFCKVGRGSQREHRPHVLSGHLEKNSFCSLCTSGALDTTLSIYLFCYSILTTAQ